MNKFYSEISKEFKKPRKLKEQKIIISNKYELVHIIEEGENDYAISAKIIVPKDSKMIKNCLDYNKSPITQALEKLEKEHKELIKDGKTENNFYFEDVQNPPKRR